MAGRIAVRQLGGSRWGKATWNAVCATASSLGHAARVLFLQITGLFFISFSVIGGLAAASEYRAYSAGQIGPERTVLALVFAAVFAWFGITSFWRAARKARRT